MKSGLVNWRRDCEMMSRIVGQFAIIVFLLTGGIAVFAEDYSLTLECEKQRVKIGEEIVCHLYMPVPEIEEQIKKATRDGKFIAQDLDQQFKYTFVVVAEKSGSLDIGPYTFSFFGREFTSNSVTVEVEGDKRQTADKTVIQLKCDIEEIKVGESFNFTMSASDFDFSRVSIKKSDTYSVYIAGRSTAVQIINGKTTRSENIEIIVVPHSEGVLVIDREFFKGIPINVEIDSLEIVVYSDEGAI